jgi:hypothetical protein
MTPDSTQRTERYPHSALSRPNPLAKPSDYGFQSHRPGHHRQNHLFDGDIERFVAGNLFQSVAASFEQGMG